MSQEQLQGLELKRRTQVAFERIKKFLGKKRELPGGLWIKCPNCDATVYKKAVDESNQVCPECRFHFNITPDERIRLLLDEGSFQEMWTELLSTDPLKFEGPTNYKEKTAKAQKATGQNEACIIGTGTIEEKKVILGMTDSRFMMGSMGSVVGEKIARGFEYATEEKLPVIFISGSGGGARMFEGCLSLMQMAKTSAAIARFHEQKGLFISILTNPTMGGVMASFAALGDIMIAEPRALIGFAGPRVIKQAIKQDLPKGFQTSEFLMEHGFLDLILERDEMKSKLSQLLHYLT